MLGRIITDEPQPNGTDRCNVRPRRKTKISVADVDVVIAGAVNVVVDAVGVNVAGSSPEPCIWSA